MSASSVYTLVSGVAFGYATVAAVQTLSRLPAPVAMSKFNRILLNFAYATLVAPSAVVPVIMWFETTKLQAYLHEWRLFQVRMPSSRIIFMLLQLLLLLWFQSALYRCRPNIAIMIYNDNVILYCNRNLCEKWAGTHIYRTKNKI